MHRNILLLCLVLALGNVRADPIPKPTLRGVTVKMVPYAESVNGTIKGLAADLMQMIGQKVGFDFQLYFSPDGSYGNGVMSGNVTGMIGEVYHKNADFAIADLTVTSGRQQYVDFTEPFLTNQLAAVLLKEDAKDLVTMEDLVNYNQRVVKSDNPGDEIGYGAISSGATTYKLSKTDDPIGKAIFQYLQANPKSMVRSHMVGLDKVTKGRFAMIAESSWADFITGQNCNLTALHDTRGIYKREFAIALQKGSKYMEPFNKAIRELKQDGSIAQLKKTYWVNKCSVKAAKVEKAIENVGNEFSNTPSVDGFNL